MSINKVDSITMTNGDFGVCFAALVQAESYWNFQLDNNDGDIPGGFSKEEVGQILTSLKEVKNKIEKIIDMTDFNETDDHVVVS